MAALNRRLLPEGLQNRFSKLLTPLVNALTRWGIHPNSLTLAGLVITFMAAAALIKGHLRIAGLLILLGGLCDSIDGNLARCTGKATRFGALFDSVIDRYSEFVMFLGIAAYFITMKNYFSLGITFLALCGSIGRCPPRACRRRPLSLGRSRSRARAYALPASVAHRQSGRAGWRPSDRRESSR